MVEPTPEESIDATGSDVTGTDESSAAREYTLRARGRGSGLNPPTRFAEWHIERDAALIHAERAAERATERLAENAAENAIKSSPERSQAAGSPENFPDRFDEADLLPSPATRFYLDDTRSPFAKNESTDLPFGLDLNPYRGCEHGCIYCYARPSHEYLGFSAGLDFETKIVVKRELPRLLAAQLRRASWRPQVIMLSGNTDCYQPVERRLRLTEGCLQVLWAHRHPVVCITKNALILRDAALWQKLSEAQLGAVTISVTTLDPQLARTMEPRASTPKKRLEAMAKLSAMGVVVGVNVAPLIPGLTEHEIPAILKAAAEHGARRANYSVLRLPYGLPALFEEWLKHHYPQRAERVFRAVRAVHGGRIYDARFGVRMRGQGPRAQTIATLFDVHARRYGLRRELPPLCTDKFRSEPAQERLF